MNLTPRHLLGATPLTFALVLAMTASTAAQVATLVSPDETPEPEAAAEVLQFEDQNEALLAFAECMRDNGVDMDDPQAGAGPGLRGFFGGGPDRSASDIDRGSEEFQSAQEACSMYLEAMRPEIDPEAEQERLEEQLALAQCIRDHGYEQYPDPAIGTDGRLERTRGQGFEDLGIDPRSSEFREVIATCRDEMGLEGGPGFGGGAGLGPGNGGS